MPSSAFLLVISLFCSLAPLTCHKHLIPGICSQSATFQPNARKKNIVYFSFPHSAFEGTSLEIFMDCEGNSSSVRFRAQFAIRSTPCYKEFFELNRLPDRSISGFLDWSAISRGIPGVRGDYVRKHFITNRNPRKFPAIIRDRSSTKSRWAKMRRSAFLILWSMLRMTGKSTRNRIRSGSFINQRQNNWTTLSKLVCEMGPQKMSPCCKRFPTDTNDWSIAQFLEGVALYEVS